MPPRPLRYPCRPAALAVGAVLLTGCATVGGGGSAATLPPPSSAASASAAGLAAASPLPAASARPLSADRLRAAALADHDLPAGWSVTVVAAGQAAGGPAAPERQLSDVPACQPVLDAIGPANPAAQPLAETDLSLARAAAPQAAIYAALLGYPAGRSAVLLSTLDQLLDRCGSFTSAPAGQAAGIPRSRHRLARADTPTVEGADGATAFTLTNETGAVTLSQYAVVVRVGTALAVFSTVGTAKEPAAAPDPVVVLAQVRKVRAAQS